jgi:hypothetical protein
LPSAQDSTTASGKHFVGVKLRVQNKASSTYQNNVNNETTIVLSGGERLHADDNPIADCGNFDNGQIKLKGGAAGAGRITLEVPKGRRSSGSATATRSSSRRAPDVDDDSAKR